MSPIDADGLCVDLTDELGQVLQTKLVHVLVPKVDHFVRVWWVQYLTGKDRVPEKLSQDFRGRENVLTQLKECLLDRI